MPPTKKPPPKPAPKPITLNYKPKLQRVWHKFLMRPNGTGIINGSFNLHHKRYKGVKGHGAATCLVCTAFSYLTRMELWETATLDQILMHGAVLQKKSLENCPNKSRPAELEPHQVHKYIFLSALKVTMTTEAGAKTRLVLKKESVPILVLEQNLKQFFTAYRSLIFLCQGRYATVWFDPRSKAYFVFDPHEHNIDGTAYTGIRDTGCCCCVKCKTVAQLAANLFAKIDMKPVVPFRLFPARVEKMVKINTTPPEGVLSIHCGYAGALPSTPPREIPMPESSFRTPEKKTPAVPAPITPIKVKHHARQVPPPPPPLVLEPPEPETVFKPPPIRPKVRSVTNFLAMGDSGTAGILRATTFQLDPQLGLANALAALTMLKKFRAKRWVHSNLDDILKLGQWIYQSSPRINIGEFCKKIKMLGREYQPIVDPHAYLGQLQSQWPDVLDLQPALTSFLLENDCTIISAPVPIAVWRENNLFYMFDPNPRNNNGRVGRGDGDTACVTWYKGVKPLVNTYLANIFPNQIKEYFHLMKVEIIDFVELAEKWYNFDPLSFNKWILRGTFSQAHKKFGEVRNTQCTANATIAVAYSNLRPEQYWDTATIDQVLMIGNEFYLRSVDDLKAKDKYKDPMLMVDEVRRQHIVENKLIDFDIDDCLINGIINAKSDTGIPNLKKGFEEFFDVGDSAIVTANAQTMAVWKRGDIFYYYDSHSRSDKGKVCSYGTACLLRLSNIEDLITALVNNLGPSRNNLFNISRVKCYLTDTTDDGVILPPMINYKTLTDYVGILRSNLSTDHERFKLNKKKQLVPMALMAMGYNLLSAANQWTVNDLDQIILWGDKYYQDTMEVIFKNQAQDEIKLNEDGTIDDSEEPVTTDNVNPSFKIGGNKFEVEFEEVANGNYEENLKESFESLYTDDKDQFNLFFESPYLNVIIWRDDHLIYVMDPKPRNDNGQMYGKEDWPMLPPEEVEEEEDEDEEEEDEGSEMEEMDEGGAGDNFDEEEELEEEEVEEEEVVVRVFGAWKEDEEKEGRACIMRFSRLDDFIEHFFKNAPQPDRNELLYTIKSVKLTNKPLVKDVINLEEEEIPEDDPIAGPWFEFQEMDHGRWILRGTKNLDDELFPEINRGRQLVPSLISCCVYLANYSIEKFRVDTIDDILRYGDRLYTYHRKEKTKALIKNNDSFLIDDAEAVVLAINFHFEDYPKQFCVNNQLIKYNCKSSVAAGDIKSTDTENIADIATAVKTFFQTPEQKFGIVEVRDQFAVVYMKDGFYYMYDARAIGPNGVVGPVGVPCITRYMYVEDLANVLLENIGTIGENFFEMHSIELEFDQKCPRERQPEQIPPPSKLCGFTSIVPGKQILRGTIKDNFELYENGSHIESAAIAFVALAVSFVQHPETWTKLLVDQIMKLGHKLHELSVIRLGDDYNPWTHRQLGPDQIISDFKLGSKKASAVLGMVEASGLVDIKQPTRVLNLRQGIDKFFRNNIHGILLMGNQIMAMWEETIDDFPWICIFDPNPRGSTGVPTSGGVPCCMKVINSRMAFDHLLACLMNQDKETMQYTILSMDMLVGGVRGKKKHHEPPVTPCRERLEAAHKQLLREQAEKERKEKVAKKRALVGRYEYYEFNKNEWLLRGSGSMLAGREVTTNLVACILLAQSRLERYTYRLVDLIIMAGNQVFIDMVVNYKLENGVTLANVARTFYLKSKLVELEIYQPMRVDGEFSADRLCRFMRKVFERETCCMVSYGGRWISLYWSKGFYYYFEPMGCDVKGKRIETNGCACIIKIGDLAVMCAKIYENLYREEVEEKDVFWIGTLKLLTFGDEIGGKPAWY